jgi:AAA domain, putative AbiEii toxin, Type IV TA system
MLEFWTNLPQNFPRALLRQVKVEADPGLRGIQSLGVPFNFPITAICGRNGVGKSTVLALAAISGRPVPLWAPYRSNTRPKRQPKAGLGYSFQDFFHRRSTAPVLNGITINWILADHGNETDYGARVIEGRWRRIADPARHDAHRQLPPREIDVIPISRVLPPSDISGIRSAFVAADGIQVEPLSAQSVRALSFIMGKPYQAAETQTIRGLLLPNCRAGARYSGFDMGAGECAVITLLSRLQKMPIGGLVLIEEIELGLHPEAQERLIQCLVDICWKKKLQVICTTHSEAVLDSLPRQARVLLRKHGTDHESIANVSTRFAIHEMTGNPQPELMIYVEDKFAALLIEEALPNALRRRVLIREIGDKATLARQAVAHLKMQLPLVALSIFDGDCTHQEIETWIRNETGGRQALQPSWLSLPGQGQGPERWALEALRLPDYRAALALQLNCPDLEASGHVEAMLVHLDLHDAGQVLSGRTGLEREECRRRIVRSVAQRHPAMDAIRLHVEQLLR